jgi:hypothetical protein
MPSGTRRFAPPARRLRGLLPMGGEEPVLHVYTLAEALECAFDRQLAEERRSPVREIAELQEQDLETAEALIFHSAVLADDDEILPGVTKAEFARFARRVLGHRDELRCGLLFGEERTSTAGGGAPKRRRPEGAAGTGGGAPRPRRTPRRRPPGSGGARRGGGSGPA